MKVYIEEEYFQSDFFYFSKFQFCSFWINTGDNKLLNYIYIREIPAFGRISLALRGSGALGATFGRQRRPFGKPPPLAAVKD